MGECFLYGQGGNNNPITVTFRISNPPDRTNKLIYTSIDNEIITIDNPGGLLNFNVLPNTTFIFITDYVDSILNDITITNNEIIKTISFIDNCHQFIIFYIKADYLIRIPML